MPKSSAALHRDSCAKHDVELEQVIGQGAFGVVYSGHCRGVRCAVKCLTVSDPAELTRQMEEIKINKSLRHGNICQFFDFFSDPYFLYIVMEFCNHGDMQRYLDHRNANGAPFLESKLLQWLLESLLALRAIHSVKILHRDIKPTNIYLSGPKQSVKLGDFGLARVMDCTKAVTMSRQGTPYFLAPETVSGRGTSWEADVWALGVTFYELATGAKPFEATTYDELAGKILSQQPAPFAHAMVLPTGSTYTYSVEFERIVMCMLTKDPSQRPTVSDILAQPLFAPVVEKRLPALDLAVAEALPQQPSRVVLPDINGGLAGNYCTLASQCNAEKQQILSAEFLARARIIRVLAAATRNLQCLNQSPAHDPVAVHVNLALAACEGAQPSVFSKELLLASKLSPDACRQLYDLASEAAELEALQGALHSQQVPGKLPPLST